VDSGVWPLYRFDPRRREAGENPFHLDSGAPKVDLMEYLGHEARFRATEARDPERFKRLVEAERDEIVRRYALYEELARGEAHAATAIAAAHTLS
jgi:pyruvate-ferredoxin/flavodoxin oxidoreductase